MDWFLHEYAMEYIWRDFSDRNGNVSYMNVVHTDSMWNLLMDT